MVSGRFRFEGLGDLGVPHAPLKGAIGIGAWEV